MPSGKNNMWWRSPNVSGSTIASTMRKEGIEVLDTNLRCPKCRGKVIVQCKPGDLEGTASTFLKRGLKAGVAALMGKAVGGVVGLCFRCSKVLFKQPGQPAQIVADLPNFPTAKPNEFGEIEEGGANREERRALKKLRQ